MGGGHILDHALLRLLHQRLAFAARAVKHARITTTPATADLAGWITRWQNHVPVTSK
jgi:hypothetical protein